MDKMDRILTFELTGKMAHFRKFYSNISSLTYALPPRTVLAGLIGSVMELERDSYYEVLAPEHCKIGVGIRAPGRKLMQCMNYVVRKGGHTQVRLELLLPLNGMLKYQIYFIHGDNETFERVLSAVQKGDPGFGLYFGQRQFRAHMSSVRLLEGAEKITDYTGELHSLTFEENIKERTVEPEDDVTTVLMPIDMKQVEGGREPVATDMITFERQGRPLKGKFEQVLKCEDGTISFFTPF